MRARRARRPGSGDHGQPRGGGGVMRAAMARILQAAHREAPAYTDARLHLAALSMVAGSIHAVVAAPHFGEYWLFGIFFAALAVFQLGWGAWIYERPSRRA